MRDVIDGRLWADHGQAFSTGLKQLIDDIGFGFRRLVEIEFDAPWRRAAAPNGR